MSNGFPVTFPATFESGPQFQVTGDPDDVASAVDALAGKVTSIDEYDIEAHGNRTITATVTYTP
jgi:hypothetical protein